MGAGGYEHGRDGGSDTRGGSRGAEVKSRAGGQAGNLVALLGPEPLDLSVTLRLIRVRMRVRVRVRVRERE